MPRQNGKNGVIEMRELYGMVVLGERFLHTAHEVKTARKAFIRIAGFFENAREYPELAAMVKEIRKTNGQEAVLLDNGGGVEFIARSKGSGRGFTVDVLVCDEAQDLGDEELAALLPTISAAPLRNPQVVLTGTPPDPEKSHGEVFARVRADGEAGRDARLAWTDFGVADGPLPDVDDRAGIEANNPALGIRLAWREVDRERNLMSPETFARERRGWWGDPNMATGTAFGPGVWEACGDDQVAPPDGYALGVAVAWSRDAASLGAAGFDGDVGVVGAVDRRLGVGWVVPEVARIQKESGCLVVVDGRGPTKDLVPALEAAGVRLTVCKTDQTLEAWSLIFDRAQAGSLRHPNAALLNAAVAVANKRPVGDRWTWGRKQSTGDISMLEAVTLALWAANRPKRQFWGAVG